MPMQTFVVLTLGMALGWRLAGATLLLYLAVGAIGLPVFAGTPEKGIGLAYMDGKLRGCDLVRLRVCDVAHGNRVGARATIVQRKTSRPVQFEITGQTRDAIAA